MPAAGTIDPFQLVGTTLADKFRIERCVAEGGFGVVYAATMLSLEKPVALKVLKIPREFNAEAQREFVERFALEAKTIARLEHPAIVRALDHGVTDTPSGVHMPWMALEWLEGETLEHFASARRGVPIGPAEALALLEPVIDALADAHDDGIAHRDIKPANIMIVETRRGRTTRLMDFGIAKLMEPSEAVGSGQTRTRTTMQAFSPRYAAPEQASGLRTGPWTDVHALGLILTELLTGAHAYCGDNARELLSAILSPWRPTPKSAGVDVGAWEAVLARATSVTSSERQPNARVLLDALRSTIASTGASPRAFAPTSASVAPTVLATPSAPALAMTPPVPAAITTLQGAVLGAARPATTSPSGRSRGGRIATAAIALLVVAGIGTLLLRRGAGDAPMVRRMEAARRTTAPPPMPLVPATHVNPPAPLAPRAPSDTATPPSPPNPASTAPAANSSTQVTPAAPARSGRHHQRRYHVL